MRRLIWSAVLAGWVVGVAVGADEPKPATLIGPPINPPPLTAAAETLAMTLVRQHLPELALVLEPLKATNPVEYRKAMTDLATESRTLTDLRAKNPARADLALEAWKTRTRVELIAAQLANAPTPERQSQLRTAIEARVEAELRRHQFETDQAEAAVKRARENLARLEGNRDRAKEALERAVKNREVKVENRYRALLPKPKPVPPTATKPKAGPAVLLAPASMPTTSLYTVPMPSPPSPVEGLAR